MSSEKREVRAITCARDTGVGGNDCGVQIKEPTDPDPSALVRLLLDPPCTSLSSSSLMMLFVGEWRPHAVTVAYATKEWEVGDRWGRRGRG